VLHHPDVAAVQNGVTWCHVVSLQGEGKVGLTGQALRIEPTSHQYFMRTVVYLHQPSKHVMSSAMQKNLVSRHLNLIQDISASARHWQIPWGRAKEALQSFQ
jgi:hypothetical protein